MFELFNAQKKRGTWEMLFECVPRVFPTFFWRSDAVFSPFGKYGKYFFLLINLENQKKKRKYKIVYSRGGSIINKNEYVIYFFEIQNYI